MYKRQVIAQGVDLYRQHDFFEKHKDYSYYQLNYKLGQEPEWENGEEPDYQVNQIFYQRFQDNSLEYVDMTPHLGNTYPIILMNRNSMKEQAQTNPEFLNILSQAKEEAVYIIIPKNISMDSEVYGVSKKIWKYYLADKLTSAKKESDALTISYEEDVYIPRTYYRFPFRSKIAGNPVILLDNTVGQPTNDLYYAYDIMYDIEENEFDSFIEEFGLKDQIVVRSNVWDVYRHSLMTASRSMRICLALTFLLLGLQMALLLFIIRLEYRVNSMEMALKKVMGYNRYERNRRIFAGTAAVSVIGIIAAVVLSAVWKLDMGIYLLMSVLVLAAMETVCVIAGARREERAQIVRILKGDNL